MSVDSGSSVADMAFAKSETELSCIRTVCDVLKQGRVRKSLEEVLWAIVIPRPCDG